MTINSYETVELVKLEPAKIQENLPQYSSQKLCEMIVCDRYFGFGQEISAMCMEELAKRRLGGDPFVFESYIDQVYNELPVLDFKMPDIQNILKQTFKLRNIK